MSLAQDIDECTTYNYAENTASFLKQRTNITPEVGIVCGSGLGGIADSLEDQTAIHYKEIPGFTVSTVAGHSGKLVFGKLCGVPTVCMQGRFHYYEGHSLGKCVFPIRVMKLLGVQTLIVTNSAGATNPDYSVGDIMIIKDHINFLGFAGINPLRGPNDNRFGVRFPAMSNAYNADLRSKIKSIGNELGMNSFLREGVYVALGGPTYETVAEIRALRILGGDAVGMSTAPEVIVAHHSGMKVLGITLITNKCIADYDTHEIANHEEVLQTGEMRKSDLMKLVCRTVSELPTITNGL